MSEYLPLIVVDDDEKSIQALFLEAAAACKVEIKAFESWDKSREFIDAHQSEVDAVVLDVRGKSSGGQSASDSHIMAARDYVRDHNIPYAIYSAYLDKLDFLDNEIQKQRAFTKQGNDPEKVIEFLKHEIDRGVDTAIIKRYPEAFGVFGGNLIDRKYKVTLLNIIKVMNTEDFDDAESMLYNPCRTLLEQVFRTISDLDDAVLPYSILSFDNNQKVALKNCSKYLSGKQVIVDRQPQQRSRVLDEVTSLQVQFIIATTNPASHEIQSHFSNYTFQTLFNALMDVLVWLGRFGRGERNSY
ncbi:MAG: hypothetical protein K9I29_06035 [Bacteroidales bacterium]|nr:hypothetical protein [Bacteroidales bacterium]MCF8327837.1 hypothetical protein [Bacteroidales bacterium]